MLPYRTGILCQIHKKVIFGAEPGCQIARASVSEIGTTYLHNLMTFGRNKNPRSVIGTRINKQYLAGALRQIAN